LDIDILVPDIMLYVASPPLLKDCTTLNLGYLQREWHTSAAVQGIADFFLSADCIVPKTIFVLFSPEILCGGVLVAVFILSV
jgi:hypothetical protein